MAKLGMPPGRDSRGFTIHSLRRFFETFCVNASILQRVIDTWMGHHSDQSMGAVYYRLAASDSQAMLSSRPPSVTLSHVVTASFAAPAATYAVTRNHAA